jgi:hypothetical protein
MSRAAQVRRIAAIIAKRRQLEAELKEAKRELWSHAGWQSDSR